MMKQFMACLALSLLFFSGCAGPTEPPPTSIKPIDQSVVAAVKMNLKTDGELAGCVIRVEAENELLILRGEVPTEEAKARAEQIALKSAKVEKVANHLEVKP
jgi:osmotically-inducible protein OsmY